MSSISPAAVDQGPRGHMGVKSNAFCVTDAKLINQYLVQDRLNAHYKKLHATKPTVDTGPPKAYMVSQKLRDQARRTAHQGEVMRRNMSPGVTVMRDVGQDTSRSSSDGDRKEMMAMWDSLNEENLQKTYTHRKSPVNTTLEVQPSDNTLQDTQLVNNIVSDNIHSPSHYNNPRTVKSNIPPRQTVSRPTTGRYEDAHVAKSMLYTSRLKESLACQNKPSTPREVQADIIDKMSHHFTEEKPFQPRTLRTKTQSHLTSSKYYNAPKKQSTIAKGHTSTTAPHYITGGKIAAVRRSSTLRPSTPMTMGTYDSTDLMLNETLMSRDRSQAKTPTCVPPLDISLDADHMQWLKEQSHKAGVRQAAMQPVAAAIFDPTRQRTQGSDRVKMDTKLTEVGQPCQRPDSAQKRVASGYYSNSGLKVRVSHEEEELKYLEFITEVTNDVLDRGVFSDRVLKHVFDSHLERRKDDLKLSRMRQLLADLQRDLGVMPSSHDLAEGGGVFTPTCRAPSPGRAPPAERQDSVESEQPVSVACVLPAVADVPSVPIAAPCAPDGRPPLLRPRSVAAHGAASVEVNEAYCVLPLGKALKLEDSHTVLQATRDTSGQLYTTTSDVVHTDLLYDAYVSMKSNLHHGEEERLRNLDCMKPDAMIHAADHDFLTEGTESSDTGQRDSANDRERDTDEDVHSTVDLSAQFVKPANVRPQPVPRQSVSSSTGELNLLADGPDSLGSERISHASVSESIDVSDLDDEEEF